jgi:hypothetical protein
MFSPIRRSSLYLALERFDMVSSLNCDNDCAGIAYADTRIGHGHRFTGMRGQLRRVRA